MRPGNHAKGQFTAAHACPRLPCHSRDCKDAAASARAQLRVMRTCLGCSRTTPRLPTGSVLSVWPGARRSSSRSRSRWTACSSRRTPTRQSRAWPARAWRATPRSGPRSCSWSRASRPCRARRRARRARRARAARGSRPRAPPSVNPAHLVSRAACSATQGAARSAHVAIGASAACIHRRTAWPCVQAAARASARAAACAWGLIFRAAAGSRNAWRFWWVLFLCANLG